jgi:hypothetical protein
MPMMKEKILIWGLLLWSIGIYGQSKSIKIYWQELAEAPSAKAKVPSQKEQALSRFNMSWSMGNAVYHTRWVDQGFALNRSGSLTDIVWAPATRQEIKKLQGKNLPSDIVLTLGSAMARDQIYTTLSFDPFVKRNGRIEKLVSAQMNYRRGPVPSSRLARNLMNSVLSQGSWYRFEIDQTGVYKLDRNFLSSLGMDLTQLDIDRLKIYGHGGKPLPLANSENLFFDLPETPIQVVGAEDGTFDSGDYVLFYGQGTIGYDAENDSHLNPYSDTAYYYVTADGTLGQRIQLLQEPIGSVDLVFNSFQEVKFHEEDTYSPAKVGRQWFGNRFDIQNDQQYTFSFDNRLTDQPFEVKVRAAAASDVPTSMQVSVNNVATDPLNFNGVNDPTLLSVDSFREDFTLSGASISVEMTYNNSGNPSSIGYLDYVRVEATRALQAGSGQLLFRNKEAATSGGIGRYEITNAAAVTQVWDVTNPFDIKAVLNEESAATFSFKAQLGSASEYVALDDDDFLEPKRGGNPLVANQDLKGDLFLGPNGQFEDIDYLIITPAVLRSAAMRLADHHRNRSGLRVRVITLQDIYNEFSSGQQDISAIRNLVRYVYDHASGFDQRIKYLCLFGDTSVDYKDRLTGNNNMVPSYHTLSSVDTFNSFMSDDFFGMMDPNEGTMSSSHSLDIAVGRILADTPALATTVVDKILSYDDEASFGQWRNNFVIISDDVDIGWEYRALEVTLDSIADRVSAERPSVNVKKIHTDAYQQQTSAGGNRYPEAKEAIENAIELGALIVNYFGHGGEDGLAKEFIYTKETAQDLRNSDRYPCFVTVTCEFSKFDNPLRVTAGELTFWNAQGGAASLITTTRSVSVTLGVDFNTLLSEYLFGYGLDQPPAPAEALRLAKNLIGSNNKRVIFYIGDPAMHLAFPKKQIRLTAINDIPLGFASDTLQALGRVKLSGVVLDPEGNALPDYNGLLQVKVFDKDVQRATLANDGIRDNGTDYDNDGNTTNLLIMNFKTLGEVLFNGQATVTNGAFDFEFIVPRDIQIPVGQGKVSFYARRNAQFEDQTGYNLNVLVGGINENAPQDLQGPEIDLFMNDDSFISGGTTNNNPILIVKLEDLSGLNTTGGIGHDLVAVLDGDTANPFVLNDYYQAGIDDFTRGTAQFKLRDLENGPHSLQVKAWDTYNNSSIATLDFVVAGGDQLAISRVLNYPNPFVNYTEFWFNHNRPFEPLEVQVQVFTVSGKVVWSHQQTVVNQGYLSRDIIWDGRDDFGDRIGKGVYVYKLSVRSALSGKTAEKYEKLVIL